MISKLRAWLRRKLMNRDEPKMLYHTTWSPEKSKYRPVVVDRTVSNLTTHGAESDYTDVQERTFMRPGSLSYQVPGSPVDGDDWDFHGERVESFKFDIDPNGQITAAIDFARQYEAPTFLSCETACRWFCSTNPECCEDQPEGF